MSTGGWVHHGTSENEMTVLHIILKVPWLQAIFKPFNYYGKSFSLIFKCDNLKVGLLWLVELVRAC